MLCLDQDWWEHADPVCAQHGLRIARIESQPENDFAASLASTTLRGVWIDGNDLATPNDWRYVDGTQFWNGGPAPMGVAIGGAYTNWATTDPDDVGAGATVGAHCLRMFPDGVWFDDVCNLFVPFLCETP
jgi:hypothetical protein